MAQTPFSTFSPVLAAIRDLPLAADKGLYFTGAATPATFDLTAAGRALLDDADAAAQRTTLGLGGMATQAPGAVAITGGSAHGMSGQFTGSATSLTGSGVEILGGSSGLIQAYDRDAGAFIQQTFDALLHVMRVSGNITLIVTTTGAVVTGSVKPSSYTVATVPSAATHGAGATIYVSNESGGAVPAFSDGTNWRRVTDLAVIS